MNVARLELLFRSYSAGWLVLFCLVTLPLVAISQTKVDFYHYPEDVFRPGDTLPADLAPYDEQLARLRELHEQWQSAAKNNETERIEQLSREQSHIRTQLPPAYRRPLHTWVWGKAIEAFDSQRTVEWLRKNPDQFNQTRHLWFNEKGEWIQGISPPTDYMPAEGAVSDKPSLPGCECRDQQGGYRSFFGECDDSENEAFKDRECR